MQLWCSRSVWCWTVLVLVVTVNRVGAFAPQPVPSVFVRLGKSTRPQQHTPTTSTRLELIPARNKLKNLEWKSPSEEEVDNWLRKYGELSRYYRRDVFTAGDWVRTRRPTRFIGGVLRTFNSGLIRQISLEVNMLAGVSAFVVLYNNLVAGSMTGLYWISRVLPFLATCTWPRLELPLLPFNLAAASLGLLLTFRTNVCYQRWNEARTAWGKVINDSRSLARMACQWGTIYNTQNIHPNQKTTPSLLQRLGETICSFSRSLMNRTLPHQEDEKDFLLYCHDKLHPTYAHNLIHAKHRPTLALAELTSIIATLNLHPLQQMEVEKMVTELCSALGVCERIFSSPVPTFYSRHTTRFLAVWLFGLPLALYPSITGWKHLALVPIMMVLGGFLLGIEELANQMEEPFSILPMEKMCQGSIRVPVMEQVERSVEFCQQQQQPQTSQPQHQQPQPYGPTAMDPSFMERPQLAGATTHDDRNAAKEPTYTISRVNGSGELVNGAFNGATGDAGNGI